MSTAGKVLVILVMLAIIPWMILASAVAQLNANWATRLADLNKQVADTRAQVAKLQDEVVGQRNQILLIQRQRDNDVAVLRTRLSKVEKDESYTKETLSRYQHQATAADLLLTQARGREAYRLQEMNNTRAALAKAQADVTVLRTENARLRGELETLQARFLRTVRDNKALVQRLLESGPRGGVRRASLVH